MGWSNVGAVAIFTTQVNLVDENGNVDGTLDGINGLVLYGNGSAQEPGLQLTPVGDMVWRGVISDGTNSFGGQAIEIGAGFDPVDLSKPVMFMQLSSGSFAPVSNATPSAILPTSGTEDGSYGPFVVALPCVIPTQFGATINSFLAEIWHGVSYSNGWSNATGGPAPVQCRLDAGGKVIMRGRAAPGTKTDGTVMFTLPSGYAPLFDVVVNVAITAASDPASPTRIEVSTNGNVAVFGASTALTVSFDSIFWPSSLLTP